MNNNDYLGDINYFYEIINKYKNIVNDSYAENSRKVIHVEYGKGGEVLHRGFYCPSKIMDVVIGNCNRGKLLKTLRSTNPTFIYGFDELNRIITVKGPWGKECIFYDGKESTSVCFEDDNSIFMVSKCVYDDENRIVEYSKILCTHNKNHKITEYAQEKYRYEEKFLVVNFKMIFFDLDVDEPRITQEMQYTFEINDGYIGDYEEELLHCNGKTSCDKKKMINYKKRPL